MSSASRWSKRLRELESLCGWPGPLEYRAADRSMPGRWLVVDQLGWFVGICGSQDAARELCEQLNAFQDLYFEHKRVCEELEELAEEYKDGAARGQESSGYVDTWYRGAVNAMDSVLAVVAGKASVKSG